MGVFLKRFLKDESGATAIEYGLIIALISVVVVIAVQTLLPGIAAVFNTAETQLEAVTQ